jgi:hypothetical protein
MTPTPQPVRRIVLPARRWKGGRWPVEVTFNPDFLRIESPRFYCFTVTGELRRPVCPEELPRRAGPAVPVSTATKQPN